MPAGDLKSCQRMAQHGRGEARLQPDDKARTRLLSYIDEVSGCHPKMATGA